MRANPTSGEQRLWWILRAKRIGGFKFRRQHAIGRYIVDFVCLQARLIVEVDGDTHGEEREQVDEQRTAYLTKLGYRVIRFWNTDVFESPEDVAGAIAYALGMYEGPAPLPSPLPCGERE